MRGSNPDRSNVGRQSLVVELQKHSKRIPRAHVLMQPFRGRPDTLVTTHGYAYFLEHACKTLPKTMPYGLQCVTWLPKSRKVGESMAKWVAKRESVSCLPLDVVRGNPFNVMVIAPRLDSAYIAHVLELEDLIAYRKKCVAERDVPGYGKGDFMVWSLVVDTATKSMADIFHLENNQNNVFTTLDSYLLDGSALA